MKSTAKQLSEQLVTALLSKYNANTGVIVFQSEDGEVKTWAIGAKSGVDNASTMKAHLKTFFPKCKFLAGGVK